MLIARGQILKQAIKAEGLTEKQFAEAIGVSTTRLGVAIHRNDFSDDLIEKITNFFGNDWSFLQKEAPIRYGRKKKWQNM